jgi:prepilin signal peptidase PulO-like enzyme (type II secretory pathway)
MISILLFIFGIVFGSFVSAYSWRYPRGLSVAKGRSICPNCKKQIEWYDNLPLVSYLILEGKCRHCKKHISLRYPIMELATAVGFVIIGGQLVQLAIFVLLELIFVIDLENQIIPDDFVFFGIVLVLFLSIFTNQHSIFSPLFSGLLAASLLLFIHLVTLGRGMGLGDVKFAVLGGMLVGLNMSLVWLFMSFLAGGIFGSVLLLSKNAKLKDKIAFGPFLIIGIGLTFMFGDSLLKMIMG